MYSIKYGENMAVYLAYGKKKKTNQFQHISEVKSGKTALVCPFCECKLIAVKGTVKAHHFRHDGETCHESLTEIPKIPGWHHFHLNYPLELIEYIKEREPHAYHNPIYSFPRTFGFKYIYDEQLLNGKGGFTDTALVTIGKLSLPKFNKWFRKKLKERITEYLEGVANNNYHQAWYDIEAHRQQNLLNSTLYFFEYQLDDDTKVWKVGKTSRNPKDRLLETTKEFEKSTGKKVVKADILRNIKNAGINEKYILYKYKKNKLPAGSLQEYLLLDKNTLKNLKFELTKLSKSIDKFDKDERWIATGRWTYENKRIEALRKGIKKTIAEGGNFGRPVGSAKSELEFLEKHWLIILELKNGMSVRKTAQRCKKSVSTVQRVKKVYDNHPRKKEITSEVENKMRNLFEEYEINLTQFDD